MKILIISHEYPPVGGGGANACMYLSREFARAGHEVHIVTVWFEGTPEYEEITDYGAVIQIIRLKAKRKKKEHCGFGEMLDFLMKADRCVKRLVRESIKGDTQYDICQIFFGIPSGPVGYHMKKRYGLPYVIRFGGGDIPGFQERFRIVYRLIGPFIRLIWKGSDALVANSEGLKALAEEFCNRYPILIFPNGVDTDMFAPLSYKDYDGHKIELLFASRLIERKGLQYVIPGLRKIEEKAQKSIHLTIVGDGPYRQTLETLADEHKVRDLLSFVGQKDKEDLLQYYQCADIFVFPSKKEGMPNAVLEAMACALPIVMSPCQGSHELIDGNGIVSDHDLGRFNEFIEKLINEPQDYLKTMSTISRKRAVDIFSWKSVADNYIGLFDKIINRGVSENGKT